MTRILVVEDDSNTRYLIKQNLQQIGYEVVEAENGLQALEILREDVTFQAILSDIQMDGMDGLTLLQHLRSDYPHIPVMMLSVYGRMDWVDQAMAAGATCYLLKPFTHQQLIDIVRDVVEARI
jgi:two-component system response regulator FlrC